MSLHSSPVSAWVLELSALVCLGLFSLRAAQNRRPARIFVAAAGLSLAVSIAFGTLWWQMFFTLGHKSGIAAWLALFLTCFFPVAVGTGTILLSARFGLSPRVGALLACIAGVAAVRPFPILLLVLVCTLSGDPCPLFGD